MKKCENPLFEELVKTFSGRNYNLSDLKLPEGYSKACVWCLSTLTGSQRRWCSPECSEHVFGWANPQKEYGLWILLNRQDFKCLNCKFDYSSIIENMFLAPKIPYGMKEHQNTWKTKYSYWVINRLKSHFYRNDKEFRPEVDHLVPISKGGQSIGFDNVNCLCYTCHKAKTKIDNSGPRKKKLTNKENK